MLGSGRNAFAGLISWWNSTPLNHFASIVCFSMHLENMIHGNNMNIQDCGNQQEEEDFFSPSRNISFVDYFCTWKKQARMPFQFHIYLFHSFCIWAHLHCCHSSSSPIHRGVQLKAQREDILQSIKKGV